VSNRVVDVVQIERGDLEVIEVDQTGANEANHEGRRMRYIHCP